MKLKRSHELQQTSNFKTTIRIMHMYNDIISIIGKTERNEGYKILALTTPNQQPTHNE